MRYRRISPYLLKISRSRIGSKALTPKQWSVSTYQNERINEESLLIVGEIIVLSVTIFLLYLLLFIYCQEAMELPTREAHNEKS